MAASVIEDEIFVVTAWRLVAVPLPVVHPVSNAGEISAVPVDGR